MTRLFAALVIFLATPAWPQYTDNPTSAWFKNLRSQYAPNCCDQSDCHRADSEWRGTPPTINERGELVEGEGDWWAKSNTTGTWVKIRPDQITKDAAGNVVTSILEKAILCERPDPDINDVGELVPRPYCFAPPPLGF